MTPGGSADILDGLLGTVFLIVFVRHYRSPLQVNDELKPSFMP